MLDDLARDVRFAWRTFLRNPSFTLVAVLSLALATGATTAIFSVVNGVLLRPLPFDDPDALVQVYGRNWLEDRGAPDPITGPVGSLELEEMSRQATSFAGFAGYGVNTRHLQGSAGVERLTAVVADLALFPLLGVRPIAGRTFGPGDPQDVVVISARLWRERFGGDPALPGKTVTLDGRPFTIVGVMGDGFQFPYRAASLMSGSLPESRTDVWVPIEPLRASSSGDLRRGRVTVVGRMKPGITLDAASAELRVVARRVEEQHYRGTRARVGVRIAPLVDAVVGPVRRSLWMLFAAVGLVLAAACANVANLLLARMAVRTREVVTRAALGAGRFRLVRQFLAESLLLALAGGLGGAAIARWGADLLVGLGAARIPRAHEITLDWQAFGFLLVVCLGTAVLFGLAPALAAARMDVQVAKEAGGHATVGARFARVRDALVVIEVALAFVLALGAAVVMREAARVQRVENGMLTDNVLTLHLTPRASAQEYYAIEARVAQLPAVRAAGFIQLVPLQNWGWTGDFSIRGRAPGDARATAGLRYVTPGYFRALGIPVLRGRTFTHGDTAESRPVILVNDALARMYFPGEDPVGKDLDRGSIVGVVGDVRQVRLDRPAEPEIYYPAAQNVTMASDLGMSLVVRTAGPPETLTDTIRSAVRGVNPNLAIFNVRTMARVLEDSLWELNLYSWSIGLFAALALLLAAIGLYGVVSYNVTSRAREFAVRLALGSDPASLARLVLGRAIRLTSLGLAVGILAALAVSPFVANLPVGVRSGPATYAAICTALLAIAIAASTVPLMRVRSVNPAAALRHE